MKNGEPETLEEALKLLAEKEEIIRQKDIENAQQADKILKQNKEINKQAKKIIEQAEKIAKLTAWRFSRHSEKCTNDQLELDLFDYELNPVPKTETKEAETESKSEETTEYNLSQEIAEKVQQEKKKSNKGRKKISKPENMVVREYRIDVDEDKQNCPNCGAKMEIVRYETSERIVHVSSSEYIERVVKVVRECRNCENEDGTAVTAIAEEKKMVDRSITTPELLAFIFTQKFAHHIPFYRLSESYGWMGMRISRQSMSDWLIKCWKKLKPLEDLLKKQLGKGKILQMDETEVDVLRQSPDEIRAEYKDDKKALKYMKKAEEKKSVFKSERENCYMWVFLGGTEEKPVHLYQFFWTRSGENVEEFLNLLGSGVIMTDGYKGYDSVVKKYNDSHPDNKISHCGCWIHAKRYFNEALIATKNSSETAKKGLKYCQKVLHIEKQLRELFENKKITEEEFLKSRKENLNPVFEEFHSWLLKVKNEKMVLESSSTGDAVSYLLNQWNKLISFVDFSYCPAHNNSSENAVRPFTVGRKNWLFAGSGDGARASAFMYSLIETAKLQKLIPEDYLRCLFTKAPYAQSESDWENLLPWNIKITPFFPRGDVIGLTGEN